MKKTVFMFFMAIIAGFFARHTLAQEIPLDGGMTSAMETLANQAKKTKQTVFTELNGRNVAVIYLDSLHNKWNKAKCPIVAFSYYEGLPVHQELAARLAQKSIKQKSKYIVFNVAQNGVIENYELCNGVSRLVSREKTEPKASCPREELSHLVGKYQRPHWTFQAPYFCEVRQIEDPAELGSLKNEKYSGEALVVKNGFLVLHQYQEIIHFMP